MAFPTVNGTPVGTNGTTATTTPVVNLPSGIVAEEIVLVFIRSASVGDITWPAGWNEIFDNQTVDATALGYRRADGTEGATVTLGSESARFAAVSWRIGGSSGKRPTIPETTNQSGSSANPDPPLHTPTGGAADFIWFALMGCEGEQTMPPTYPTNYSSNQIDANSGTVGPITSNCRVAGGTRNLNASSEDPGTFTISTSDAWVAATVSMKEEPMPVLSSDNTPIGFWM